MTGCPNEERTAPAKRHVLSESQIKESATKILDQQLGIGNARPHILVELASAMLCEFSAANPLFTWPAIVPTGEHCAADRKIEIPSEGMRLGEFCVKYATLICGDGPNDDWPQVIQMRHRIRSALYRIYKWLTAPELETVVPDFGVFPGSAGKAALVDPVGHRKFVMAAARRRTRINGEADRAMRRQPIPVPEDTKGTFHNAEWPNREWWGQLEESSLISMDQARRFVAAVKRKFPHDGARLLSEAAVLRVQPEWDDLDDSGHFYSCIIVMDPGAGGPGWPGGVPINGLLNELALRLWDTEEAQHDIDIRELIFRDRQDELRDELLSFARKVLRS